MGNQICNCSQEYENYLKTIASTHYEIDKPFFWGSKDDGSSFMHFLEISTRKLIRTVLPSNITLYNQSTGLYVNCDKILIAGGIDGKNRKISSDFMIYHIESQYFEKQENIPVPVYGATGCYFLHRFYVLGGRGYGSDDASITADCYEYNFSKRRWFSIAPMTTPRYQAQSFVYQNKIWVIGGKSVGGSGNSIEFYEPHLNLWTKVIERLPFDYWGACLLTFEANRICLVGGGSSDGKLRTIHHIDLKKKNIMSKGSLRLPRENPKILCQLGHRDVCLIGGATDNGQHEAKLGETLTRDFQRTEFHVLGKHVQDFDFDSTTQNVRQVFIKDIEPVYQIAKHSTSNSAKKPQSYKSRSTQSNKSSEEDFIVVNDRNTSIEQHESPVFGENGIDSIAESRDSFQMQSLPAAKTQKEPQANEPEIVQKLYQKFAIQADVPDNNRGSRMMMVTLGNAPSLRISKRNYIFGTDEHPFYLFMDRDTFECKMKPIPLDLPLFSEQGAIRFNHLEVLFCGGRSFSESRSVSGSKVYNLKTKTTTKLGDLNTSRYGIAFALYNGVILVVGGKTIAEERKQCCLDTIEVLDLETGAWTEHPAKLVTKRSHSVCFVLGSRLYCAGGIDDTGRPVVTIERLSVDQTQWETIQLALTGCWSGLSIYKFCPTGVIIFGGDQIAKITSDAADSSSEPTCLQLKSRLVRQRGTKIADMRIGFLVFNDVTAEFEFYGKNIEPEKTDTDEKNIIIQMKSVLSRVFSNQTSLGDCSLVRPFKQTYLR